MSQQKAIKPERYILLQGHPNGKIYLTYDQHATLAFNITFKEICDLENPRKSINLSGAMSVPAIAYWFLTFDSYLNAHLKICCAIKQLNVNKYLNLSVTQKVLSLIDLLEIDKVDFNENEIIGKVHELAQFRNVLFDERYEDKEMIFRKTHYSNYPLHADLNDVFQTILILLEIAERLNHVYPGVRMMPAITLSNSNSTIAEPFNTCFREILLPCFTMASEKQHRQILFNPDIEEYPSSISRKFENKKVKECFEPQGDGNEIDRIDTRPSMRCLNRINDFLSEHENLEMVLH
jgi:hypothetical protein